jgi:hypothetical protein
VVDTDTPPFGASGDAADRLIVWPAVGRGGAATLLLLAVTSVTQAAVDPHVTAFATSAWVYPFFAAVLVSYTVGGFLAGGGAPTGALTNGALAGLLGFLAWIPLRIAIWWVHPERKGLLSGPSPVLRVGQLFGHVVIASAVGMLGGYLGARRARVPA